MKVLVVQHSIRFEYAVFCNHGLQLAGGAAAPGADVLPGAAHQLLLLAVDETHDADCGTALVAGGGVGASGLM